MSTWHRQSSIGGVLVTILCLAVASQHVVFASASDVARTRQNINDAKWGRRLSWLLSGLAVAVPGMQGWALVGLAGVAANTEILDWKKDELAAELAARTPAGGGGGAAGPLVRELSAGQRHITEVRAEVPEGLGEVVQSASVGQLLSLVVEGAGPGDVVTFDGVEADSVFDSETGILSTIVPLVDGVHPPPACCPVTAGSGVPRTIELVVSGDGVSSPPVMFEVVPPPLLPDDLVPGSLLQRLVRLQLEQLRSYASWNCSAIWDLKEGTYPTATPEERSAFVAACDASVAAAREGIAAIERSGYLEELARAHPVILTWLERPFLPSLSFLDEFEIDSLPPISDPDSDGIPAYRDNCPTRANADQQDVDHSHRGDACEPGITLNSLLTLSSVKTSFSATPVPGGPAGTLTVLAEFASAASKALNPQFFEVVELSDDNVLLNADGRPTGAGARVSVVDPAVSSGGVVVFPGQPIPYAYEFRIGLQSRHPFRFVLNVIGVSAP